MLILYIALNAQHEADTWYFGEKAGLKFSGSGVTALTDGQMDAFEGCAAISDPKTGDLLFYTDGEKVWNRNHQVMPNGSGLHGFRSSVQSAVIVPAPCHAGQYYIFTVDGITVDIFNMRTNFPNDSVFSYSMVDMSADGGLGDVTTKNVKLFSPVNETVTAVKHANGLYTWVVSHEYLTDRLIAWLVTENGIEGPVISESGLIQEYDYLSHLKFSPDGNLLAFGHREMQIFDFDKISGKVAPDPLQLGKGTGAYGFSFSPDSRLLYAADQILNIIQYDLRSGDEETIIASSDTICKNSGFYLAALQCGPDGKIYVADDEAVSVINHPNVIGKACDYHPGVIYLDGRKVVAGLPNFVESFLDPGWVQGQVQGLEANFEFEALCDSTIAVRNTSTGGYLESYWDFGDGTNAYDSNSMEHRYSKSGTYDVTLAVANCSEWDTIVKTITIKSCSRLELPNVFTPNNDGVNDFFIPINTSGVSRAHIQVYNRWGKELWHSSDLNKGWDGSFNHQACAEGVYYWVVRYENNEGESKQQKGFVTLFRE